MDGLTDGRTHPLIEMRSKNQQAKMALHIFDNIRTQQSVVYQEAEIKPRSGVDSHCAFLRRAEPRLFPGQRYTMRTNLQIRRTFLSRDQFAPRVRWR